MTDFPPEPPSSSEPPSPSEGTFGGGCATGLGLGVILGMVLGALLSAFASAKSGDKGLKAFLLVSGFLLAGYAGVAILVGRRRGSQYRIGLGVAVSLVLGVVLLNPLSLCLFTSLCK